MNKEFTFQIVTKNVISPDQLERCKKLQLENICTDGRGITRIQAIDEAGTFLLVTDKSTDKIIGYAAITKGYGINFPNPTLNNFIMSQEHSVYVKLDSAGIYVDQLLIDPNYRNRDIGKSIIGLLQHVYGRSIYLHVNLLNKQALRFCSNCYFTPVGVYESADMISGQKYVSWLYELEYNRDNRNPMLRYTPDKYNDGL